MRIYTIHGNDYEDEAAIGLSIGYFTDEQEAIQEVDRLQRIADDPEDYEFAEGARFWYNVYSPHSA